MRLIQKTLILASTTIFFLYALQGMPILFTSPAFAANKISTVAGAISGSASKPVEVRVYGVQAASCLDEDSAWSFVDELGEKGIKADVHSLKDRKGQIWHVVIAGTYGTPARAEEAVKKLRQMGEVSPLIVSYNKNVLERRKLVHTSGMAKKVNVADLAVKKERTSLAKPYSVQVAACLNEESACTVASTLTGKGYTPEIYSLTGKTGQPWYLVLLGFYDTRAGAEKAAQSYREREKDEAIVKVFDRELPRKLKQAVKEQVVMEETFLMGRQAAGGTEAKPAEAMTAPSPEEAEAPTEEAAHEEETETRAEVKKEEPAAEEEKGYEKAVEAGEGPTVSAKSFAYTPPVNEFKVAVTLSNYSYEEPDVMKIEGILYGISGSYTYTYKEGLMLRVEGHINYGSMEYNSEVSGDESGIPDYLFEFRFLIGPDLFPMSNMMITPYIGIGYRYLHDDSSGETTSLGYSGFLRESNYYYAPIGISATTDYIKGWAFSFLAEYDYLGKGRQKSTLSEIGSPFDVVNYQTNGYAIRFSLSGRKQAGKMDYVIEPFITYWNIGLSDEVLEADRYLYYEPQNNTLQYGINIGAWF